MNNALKRNLFRAAALLLAVLIVIALGCYSREASLKATDEDEAAQAAAQEVTPEVVVQEVVIPAEEVEAETPAEAAEEAPAEEAASEEEGGRVAIGGLEDALPEEEPAEEAESTETPADAELTDAEPTEEAAAEEAPAEETLPPLTVRLTYRILDEGRVTFGTRVQFTANVSGAQGEVSYQWQYSDDNANWSDISGANAQTYVFTYSESNYQGFLRVVVTEG